MKNVVRDNSNKVEEALVEFWSSAGQITGVRPSTSEPEEKEADIRGKKVSSGDGLQDAPVGSAGATQAEGLNWERGAGGQTPEHTPGPVLEVEPVQVVKPGGVSPSDFLNLEEDMGEMGA